jgi:hypothetical protein
MEEKVRARFVGAVLSVMISLTAGCTGEGGGTSTSPTGSPSPSPSPSPTGLAWAPFDPPTKFDPTPAFALGTQDRSEDVLLHGTNAFLATPTDLRAFDLTTQRMEEPIKPERPPVGGDPQEARLSPVRHTPVLAEAAGRPVVVVPYPVTIPAQGTTREAPGLDLLVVDAESRKPLPTITLDFTDDAIRGDLGISAASVVGVRGSVIVLSIDQGPAVVVDLTSRKTLWQNKDVRAGALLGDTVLAFTFVNESKVLGLALGDGATRWTALPKSYDFDIAAIGPKFAVVTGADYSSAEEFYALIDADGKLTNYNKHAPDDRQGDATCQLADTSVAVCTFLTPARRSYLAAFDTVQGQELWRLPDEAARRSAPTVTAVWHGLVYGQADAGPVVLDARTGKDKLVPPIAPVAIDSYAAVAKPSTPEQPIEVYRAVG